MKTITTRLVLCLAALLALDVAPMFAQTNGLMRVSVPFDFTVSGQKMPAGDYSIEQTGQVGTLIFHNFQSRRSVMVLGGPAGNAPGSPTPGLTFERHNGVPAVTRVVTNSSVFRTVPLQ